MNVHTRNDQIEASYLESLFYGVPIQSQGLERQSPSTVLNLVKSGDNLKGTRRRACEGVVYKSCLARFSFEAPQCRDDLARDSSRSRANFQNSEIGVLVRS
jgi:hypothetical protein